VTYTKAALTGLLVAGFEGSAESDGMGDKKQAAAMAAARFLYMVVLYMAPVEQNKYPLARRYSRCILKQVYKVSFTFLQSCGSSCDQALFLVGFKFQSSQPAAWPHLQAGRKAKLQL
jgi:hypothetical protein